jgi:indole-3-glycerol phosphate synthase
LSSLGVDGFLIGTSIMESEDPISKVREWVR